MYKCVFWNYVRKEEVLQVKFTLALEHVSDSPECQAHCFAVYIQVCNIYLCPYEAQN